MFLARLPKHQNTLNARKWSWGDKCIFPEGKEYLMVGFILAIPHFPIGALGKEHFFPRRLKYTISVQQIQDKPDYHLLNDPLMFKQRQRPSS